MEQSTQEQSPPTALSPARLLTGHCIPGGISPADLSAGQRERQARIFQCITEFPHIKKLDDTHRTGMGHHSLLGWWHNTQLSTTLFRKIWLYNISISTSSTSGIIITRKWTNSCCVWLADLKEQGLSAAVVGRTQPHRSGTRYCCCNFGFRFIYNWREFRVNNVTESSDFIVLASVTQHNSVMW